MTKTFASRKDDVRVMRATFRILSARSVRTRLKGFGVAVRDRHLKGVYPHADERIISEYSDQFDGALGSDKLHYFHVSIFRDPLDFQELLREPVDRAFVGADNGWPRACAD